MKTRWYRHPFLQVLLAIVAGGLLGHADPVHALALKPVGDAFVAVIRILVVPIIFFTVTTGVAAIGDGRKLGWLGLKAFAYFECMTALALLAGLAAAWLLQPGAGFHFDAVARPGDAVPAVGDSPVLATLQAALFGNVILQTMLAALLCGVLLARMGPRGQQWRQGCAQLSEVLFRIVRLVLKAAPLTAFCAIAYTVGKHGLASVAPLLKLLGALYLTTIAFVLGILGLVARMTGFRILRLIACLKEELMLVFGTASSIAAMPRLIEKLRDAGCAASVTGVVVPASYSFNLSGSNLYLAMAIVFLAQAADISLGPAQYLAIFLVAMLTSKGATGVAGSAFLVLTATLSAVPEIPSNSLLFIFSIERLLKCRSLGNLVANGVAGIVIAAWTGQLDREKLQALA